MADYTRTENETVTATDSTRVNTGVTLSDLTIVLKEDKPILGISVAGGDLQDQTTLNVLLNFVEFGMMPEKAVTAPRFCTGHHQDSFDPRPDREQAFVQAGSLNVNASVSADVQEELVRRGHELGTVEKAIAAPVMLYVDHDASMFYAAGDPAAGRHAAALNGDEERGE